MSDDSTDRARNRPGETEMTDSTKALTEGGSIEDFEQSDGGEIPAVDAATPTVVVETSSRSWQGSPREFYALREALNAITFAGSPESDEEKDLEAVYEDRNLLACAVAELLPAGLAGWTPAPDTDGDEWAIVWIETPSGQMSWHVPRELAERLVPRNDDYEWDGHDRDEKNDRLADWAEQGCPY